MRVFTAALRRNGGDGTLKDLEQRLLHALAGHIARDRNILALSGDLIDLVDINDALLRLLHVVIRGLNELEQDVLHVLAHIAGLGQACGVRHGERHVQDLGERLCEHRLAAAGWAEHDDIALLQLHIVFLAVGGIDTLIVVVDRDGKRTLGRLLADHIFVELVENLLRLGHLGEVQRCGLGVLLDDLVAKLHAFVADIDAGARDQAVHLVLLFAAKCAADGFIVVFCHICSFITSLRG